ncbi:MAG TPA: 4Fe-4S dicluster domain-containing protein [Paludibacter sp.]|nr:4Fe-4S dicluster domain-containing protein [Paludibacter sp.]
MKRTIIKIDEELCNGCEACVQGCHEGALQMIDGKARMVSELFCDGLGACIGDCPVGAIELEEREAEPYDEIATIERMIPKGEKTIIAHLKHLKEHGEIDYLKQGVGYLRANDILIDFAQVHNHGGAGCATKPVAPAPQHNHGGGCPGSREMSFTPAAESGFKMAAATNAETPSQLRQWPVQLHLLNPEAGYFKGADVVLAADCVAFSFADFHNRFLAGKILAIACPKLDSNKESYVEKLKNMIVYSAINTLTVVIMEVPCCGGLLALAQKAIAEAGRKIPVKLVVIGTRGDVLKEEWV